jgi:hypothetical protein
MAKKFFYVCAGVFLIVLAYHLGALRAEAQVSKSSGSLESVTTRRLTVVDEQGRARVELAADGGMAYIMLKDEAGVARTGIAVGADGSPLIALSDANGTPRVAISGRSDLPCITLADGNGSARLQLALAKDIPSLALMAADKSMRATVAVGSNAQGNAVGFIGLFDSSGRSVWQAPK